MSSFLVHFNENGCTNLYQWVRDVVPSFVCDNPTVHYRDWEGEVREVNDLIVSANLTGIRRAWGLARGLGDATLIYQLETNSLIVRPGVIDPHSVLLGQVAGGLARTIWNNGGIMRLPLCEDGQIISHFYGIQHYMLDRGSSVISSQLACLITSYIKQIQTIIHRVESSYGSMISLEGLDMGDEPLLDAVQKRINADWDASRRIQAPGGSKLGEIDISLTDTDKMLIPLEDAIATESQVPRSLLFPNKFVSQFELENLAIWARREFQVTVSPALWKTLTAQGYDVLKIDPPDYRDSHYAATVQNVLADTRYKDSASEKNQAAVKAIEAGEAPPTSNMGRQL